MKSSQRRSLYLAIPLLLISTTVPAESVPDGAGSVSVNDAYVRAVPPGQPNSAAFMQLHNGSSTHHTVVDAASPAAKTVELHTHIKKGGMMKMRRIDKIDIHPNSQAVLKPGGQHIMLMGLKKELNPGNQVSITITFGDGSTKEFTAPVRKLKMKMDMGKGKGMKDMGMKMDKHSH
ncbi:MAG: copper chaperone PCu(A)C [Gammaproteobacteria bacterium]|nr:copper chaperone PCu(A)C [Gammaproteobacteria bacterium]